MLLITINAIPSVLGRTRQSYLSSFVQNNRINNQGYSNSISSISSVSFEATAYAIDILEYYGRNQLEIETLQNNLENNVDEMFDNDEVVLYDLFFLMKSLNILQHEDIDLENRIYKYLNDTEQIGGGFSFKNSTSSANLASTYYVIQLYLLIDEPINNLTAHKNWILSCNNSDGGYGGSQGLSSTLTDTFFVVSLLDELWGIDALVDMNKTLHYLKSFYVDDSADLNSFGGYLPDEIAQYALLSSTFFCVKSISLIDPDLSELNRASTIAWVLARQYFEDGGFAENSEGYEQKVSSVISSYYGFETLRVFNALSSLAGEIWMVEFNFWILGIVLMSIGIIVALIVFFWRKRRI